MGDLSERFASLMARMAKSDADLFRTIGEQNVHVRQMVEELTAAPEAGDQPLATSRALSSASLLPVQECELQALKLRFGKLAKAQAWLEERIGQAPKKPTWAVIEQTCRQGAWPTATPARRAGSSALTATAMEERLAGLEQRLDQRLQQMEHLLALIAEAVIERRQVNAHPQQPCSEAEGLGGDDPST